MPKNYISNNDESARMFKSNFIESLSKVHWSIPLIIYLPVVLYNLYIAVFSGVLTYFQLALYYFLGIIVWSFTEYFLHRFIFHYSPKSQWGKRIHFIFHGVHHDYPKDSRRLVMPPSVSVPLAILFYFLFKALVGVYILPALFAGFMSGYIAYDMIHYAIHYYNTKNKFWLIIKNHHIKHHYQNPERGYGVSQPIWDYIFGTTFIKD